jgi:hypothetical protein
MRTVSTMTAALWPWAAGRWAADGPPSALERPGVSWRPVVTLLDDHVTVLLVNAHPSTAGPGRTTAVRDCAGRGDLLRPGVLQGRGLPPGTSGHGGT